MIASISPRSLVVVGACLTQFTVIGFLFAYGVIFEVLESEFGWSRTVLSASWSVATLTMGLLSIPGGRLADRYGPRRILMGAGLFYGLGFVLLSQIQEPWHLLVVFGFFLGIGFSTHDVITLSAISRWFEGRRGMMTAVAKIGTALGQTVLPQFTVLLLLLTDWRTALVIVGLTAGVVLVFAASLIRYPDQREPGQTAETTGLEFSDARRTRAFWTIGLLQFLHFPIMMTVPVHIAVHGGDLGLSKAGMATLLSVMGGSSIVGRLVVGLVIDRLGSKAGYLIGFTGLALSLSAFWAITESTTLFFAVAVYGFSHGGFFVIAAPTIARFFGTRAHGSIFGTIIFFGTIGAAFGPVLAGRVFDVTGSYDLAFLGMLALAVMGFLIALTLRRPPVSH